MAVNNPWDGISGLSFESVDSAVDFVYSLGFITNGKIKEDYSLIINNASKYGFVLYGPYTNSVVGTYDITVYYDIKDQKKASAYLNGSTKLARVSFDSNENL